MLKKKSLTLIVKRKYTSYYKNTYSLESELAMYRSAVRGNIIEAITTLVKEMEKLSMDYEHEVIKRNGPIDDRL